MPSTIERIHRELKDEGLVVLAINLAEKRDLVATWVKSRNVTSTVLLDPSKEVEKSYQIAYTPTSLPRRSVSATGPASRGGRCCACCSRARASAGGAAARRLR